MNSTIAEAIKEEGIENYLKISSTRACCVSSPAVAWMTVKAP